MSRTRILAACLLAALLGPPAASRAQSAPDTMVFRPLPGLSETADEADSSAADSLRRHEAATLRLAESGEDEWLRAPIGDDLLTDPDAWSSRHYRRHHELQPVIDYNRVDLVRWGGWLQAQQPATMMPRLGARLENATGRKRVLYGVQIEQPLLPTARFVLGVEMGRRTEHPELQQVDDVENSLVLLTAHEDWRDYFEREGAGAYLSWRVPDFSTVSVRARRDRYRSLQDADHVHSWWHNDHPLRPNPAIDDGESHTAVVRLERLAHRTQRTRAGVYHWLELERSGGPLGGDFDYTRALADVRSVVRVTPGSTFSLRAVGGAAIQGVLPRQKSFSLGGPDGLRAHAVDTFSGDHLALVQGEYSFGLFQIVSDTFDEGLRALVFTDAGSAWNDPQHGWAVGSQHFSVDGGFGIAESDDGVRLTFAKDLQQPDSDFVVSLRLQRPF